LAEKRKTPAAAQRRGSLELEPGVSGTEVEAESQREQLQLPFKAARKHPGRQELPAELPRTEQIIACTAEQCVCGKCGKQTAVIGYESSEQLDVEPAKYTEGKGPAIAATRSNVSHMRPSPIQYYNLARSFPSHCKFQCVSYRRQQI